MTDYTTHSEVSALLQISAFTESSKPTIAQVEKFISRAETRIEQKTGHAWRAKAIDKYEYHDIEGQYYTGTGVPTKLSHRSIRDFDTAEGDKLEIWNGSSWEDFITDRTEGRANDFWVDYTEGVVWLRAVSTGVYFPRIKGMRLIYRYGEEDVPEDIEEACTKMAAINLALNNDETVQIPEGGWNVAFNQKVDFWNKEIIDILHSRKEIQVFS